MDGFCVGIDGDISTGIILIDKAGNDFPPYLPVIQVNLPLKSIEDDALVQVRAARGIVNVDLYSDVTVEHRIERGALLQEIFEVGQSRSALYGAGITTNCNQAATVRLGLWTTVYSPCPWLSASRRLHC